MTSILSAREDKDRALFVVSKVLEQFLFHGMSAKDIALVARHFTWMKAQTPDLKVNARFETFPATKTTRITLDLSFAEEVAPFVAGKT